MLSDSSRCHHACRVKTSAIEVVDGGVVLNGSANVVATDVDASNGVVHVIDAVILPPGA